MEIAECDSQAGPAWVLRGHSEVNLAMSNGKPVVCSDRVKPPRVLGYPQLTASDLATLHGLNGGSPPFVPWRLWIGHERSPSLSRETALREALAHESLQANY